MPNSSTSIELPPELLAKIDEAVGPAGRKEFIVEVAEREIRRRRLLEALRNPEPIWKDEDHPEFVNGDSDSWVRQLRREDEARMQRNFTPSDE